MDCISYIIVFFLLLYKLFFDCINTIDVHQQWWIEKKAFHYNNSASPFVEQKAMSNSHYQL
jgi:hypothetical protein